MNVQPEQHLNNILSRSKLANLLNLLHNYGGGGGSRTRVRKHTHPAPTCVKEGSDL